MSVSTTPTEGPDLLTLAGSTASIDGLGGADTIIGQSSLKTLIGGAGGMRADRPAGFPEVSPPGRGFAASMTTRPCAALPCSDPTTATGRIQP